MKIVLVSRRVFLLILSCLTALGLLMTVQHLATAQTPPENEPLVPMQQPATSLTGWLTVVWGDGQPGTAPVAPLYRLTDENGRIYHLQFANTTHPATTLQNQQVTVEGQVLPTRAPFGEVVFQVSGIESVSRTPDGDYNNIVGPQPWVSVLCKFSDYPYESRGLDYFLNMYSSEYPGMDHYWRESSYDTMNLEGSTAVNWYTLPHTRGHYVDDVNGFANLGDLFNDCVETADPDIDYTQFVGINLMFNEQFGGYAYGGSTYATLDGESRVWRNTWIPPWGYEELAVMAHEMGHGFGLYHSLDPYGYEYGNQWDIMSSIWSNCERLTDPVYGCLGQHTIGYHKDLLGWIPADRQVIITPGQHISLTLERLALPESDNPILAKIRLGGPNSFSFLTVEARKQTGYDYKLPSQAVVLHQIDIYGTQNIFSGTLYPGDTYTDFPGQITVTVTAETDTGFVLDINYAPFSCANQTDISLNECEALLTLYNETQGNQWNYNSGWLYGSPCLWHGVICESGHVVSLSFYNNNMHGPLPDSIAQLTYLDSLFLGNNSLSGTLPIFLVDMPNLRFLLLANDNFTGPIPPEYGQFPSLEALILYGNQLTGPIPTELSNLSSLTILNLENNQLNGTIPPELGDLTGLYHLQLGFNQLTGTIPPELGNLSLLQQLNLQDNQLSGSIPPELSYLTYLYTLVLSGNELTGSIPPGIGTMVYLGNIQLADNQLSGDILFSETLTRLWAVDLSENLFTGSLPLSLPASVIILDLSHNGFTGTIPVEFLESHQFSSLDLGHNQLEGPIPAEIGGLSLLFSLDLSENRLSGSIPTEIGNITGYLQTLDLSHNQLSGEIPTSLTNLIYLTTLDVGHNALSAVSDPLQQFLQTNDPDWNETQTVPPTAVFVSAHHTSSVQLNWVTIPYTLDGGYYEVSVSTSPTGTFTVHGITADKTTNTYLVDGLQPDTVYYFLVRTFTPAHDAQQNDLWSSYSHLAFTPVDSLYLPVVFKP